MRLPYRISILFLLISCALIFGSIGSMNGMGFLPVAVRLVRGGLLAWSVQGYAAARESLAAHAGAKVGSQLA